MDIKKIIAFNWKLNPYSLKQAQKLLVATQGASIKARYSQVIVFPPFQYLFLLLSRVFKNLSLSFGAQDCFWINSGPYTGQISPIALKRLGVGFVILGHSESRFYNQETNKKIAQKIKAAVRAGLRPLLCLGEDSAIHKKGLAASRNFVKKQLQQSSALLSQTEMKNVIIVYEPVWAISSHSHGQADDPMHAAQMVSFLKAILRHAYKVKEPRVLYGGSVNQKTVNGFLSFEDIDGFLVGAASLKPAEVFGIIQTIKNNL